VRVQQEELRGRHWGVKARARREGEAGGGREEGKEKKEDRKREGNDGF
jgi:hypothetical protein